MGIGDGGEWEVEIGWKCWEMGIWRKGRKGKLKKGIMGCVIEERGEFEVVKR